MALADCVQAEGLFWSFVWVAVHNSWSLGDWTMAVHDGGSLSEWMVARDEMTLMEWKIVAFFWNSLMVVERGLMLGMTVDYNGHCSCRRKLLFFCFFNFFLK